MVRLIRGEENERIAHSSYTLFLALSAKILRPNTEYK